MKRIAAAFTLFTRIPVRKQADIPAAAYDSAVVFWPLTGWLTGAAAALAVYGLSFLLPPLPAAAVALIVRLLLTGALHEDGLADFCDGFGGGRDKERILQIMKDTYIGTFGVLGLIGYFLLTVSLLAAIPPLTAAAAIFSADAFSKCCASRLTDRLAYARPEGAKNRISYKPMSGREKTCNLLFGIIPSLPLVWLDPPAAAAALFPILTTFWMIRFLRRRIGGYTGDCCGAACLIGEAAMLLGILSLGVL